MPGKNLANSQKWLKNLKTYIQLKENLSEKVFSKMKKCIKHSIRANLRKWRKIKENQCFQGVFKE